MIGMTSNNSSPAHTGTQLVQVVKGSLSNAQRTALENMVGDIADAVERENSLKPDTRGHYGSPTPQRATNTANPTGFRTAPLPRR